MQKKKVLVWETLATVSGGQKMTLTVMDMLSDKFEFYCLIPAEGIAVGRTQKAEYPVYPNGQPDVAYRCKRKTSDFPLRLDVSKKRAEISQCDSQI